MSKINVYKCPNGHTVIIKDTEPRIVTPMFIDCTICKAQMRSSMYAVDQNLTPTHEWFVPKTIEEMKEICIPLYGDTLTDEDYKGCLNDENNILYRVIQNT